MDSNSKKTITSFKGKVVRKDLTSLMKRGANVPGYVLEYLLGMYCSSDDQDVINKGLEKIMAVLSTSYVKPDEIEKTKFILTQKGDYTIIDKVSCRVDEETNCFVGKFMNFTIGEFIMPREFANKYIKLFTGGVWCMVKIHYDNYQPVVESVDNMESLIIDEAKKTKPKKASKLKFLYTPYTISGLKPIQIPTINVDSIVAERKNFSLDEWQILMLRSCGIEGKVLNEKERFHFIERMVPFFEKNYNLVELGPRGTGKSHIYKEISPYSILMSGAHCSVSNLFYNLSRHTVGLIGNWDIVAFDEISGFGFSGDSGIELLKDYMASGSFTRGKEMIFSDASMVFLGNINDTVQNIMKNSHLFSPFPEQFRNDSAFFDRMHYYLPGWEVPKIRSSILATEFGFISDCFAEYARELRKKDYTHVFDKYIKFNSSINTRDENAIRKTISGLIKILYPDLSYTIEDLETIVKYAIEGRRRVKEQLRKISGDEFSDVDLGYITSDGREVIVELPELVDSKTLISSDVLPSGHVYTVGYNNYKHRTGIYKVEVSSLEGTGQLKTQGVKYATEVGIKAAWEVFNNTYNSITNFNNISNYDFLCYINDINSNGYTQDISVAAVIAFYSSMLNRPVIPGLCIVGNISLTQTLVDLVSLEDYIVKVANSGASILILPYNTKAYFEKNFKQFKNLFLVKYYKNIQEAISISFGLEVK